MTEDKTCSWFLTPYESTGKTCDLSISFKWKKKTSKYAFKPIMRKSGQENQTQQDTSVQSTTAYSEL